MESEGNGRMCTTLPEVLVTVMGIEKVVPSFRDLEVMLQLLPRSSTGERVNPYTSIWTGVHEGDGPRAFHLVLLDNGRTRALADDVGRDALRCIRCSACINVCPVYRQTGGHAYHTPYAGPIGAILQPQLDGERGASASLPFASTLCGACADVCPVRIDIPALLVHERAKIVASSRLGPERRRSGCSGASSAPAGRTSGPSGWRGWRNGRSPAPAGSAGSRRGRCGPGAGAASCRRCRPRRSANGGSPVTARDAMLARVRAAVGSARPDAIPRRYVERGADSAREVVDSFIERVRDYRATVLHVEDAAKAAADVLAAQVARRIGTPADLDARLRPAGFELIEEPSLTAEELDGLDGALTTCALACAATGTIALDGGAGQGRRALTLLPTCMSAWCERARSSRPCRARPRSSSP